MSEKYTEVKEINLIQLFQVVWSYRKTVLKFVLIFFLLGGGIAVVSPEEYTAKTIVVPQTGNSKSLGLGGIAAMAGFDIGSKNNSNQISPMLYPKVVKSTPFLKELLRVSLQFENLDKEVTYQEYYEKHERFNLLVFIKKYTIGLPRIILKAIRGNNEKKKVFLNDTDGIYTITKQEFDLFKQIGDQLVVKADSKEGFVSLSFSMPEARASAKMAQRAQELLQDFITKFKVNKVKEELHFIEERYKEAKKKFDNKQYVLANFRDRNRVLSTSRSQTRLQRLKSDYNLAFEVYTELAKKLETQRIEVKKNTPVFTVIEPVSVPIKREKPKRVLILMTFMFLGAVSGTCVVLVRDWFKSSIIS